MRRKCLPFVLLLAAIAQLPMAGSAQDTFPRDGNESLALRLYNRYRESRAKLVQLEADRIKVKGFISEVAPGSTMVGTAVAEEDTIALREINKNIANEQEWCRQLEAFWERNRAVPPASARSFAMRYGPLSHSGLRSSDPKHDEIEAAIRSIPFNGATSAPAASTAKAVATKEGAAKAGRSPFDGVWHTVRKHGGCCGYSASEDIAFATDASGMTTSAGTFLGDARGKVTGTSLPLDYGMEKNVPSGHVTLELGGDGKGFLGNFRDKNNHHGTISGSR